MALPPRELRHDDLDDIVALHQIVHADHVATGALVDHGLFARETRDFFGDHLETRGRIFGVHEAGRLIAYAVLGLPNPGDDNFGAMVGLPLGHQGRVAHIDGVAVHPAHRGQQLQLSLITHRLLAARALHRDIIYTTVSPRNLHSLGNLLRTGFLIVGRRALFGGHDRFVMAWVDHSAAADAEVRTAALDDALSQNRLLDAGFVGDGSTTENGRIVLRFVPASAFEAAWSETVTEPEL